MQAPDLVEQRGANRLRASVVDQDNCYRFGALVGAAHRGERVLTGELSAHAEVAAERPCQLCLGEVELHGVGIDGEQQRSRRSTGSADAPHLGTPVGRSTSTSIGSTRPRISTVRSSAPSRAVPAASAAVTLIRTSPVPAAAARRAVY